MSSFSAGLRLYDTLSKSEKEFTPMQDNEVRMYTCGPTVYGRPHVGNYSSFLMADLLRRWLEAGHGYRVIHVKNITDVGHLVADRDEGEDKVEKEARQERSAGSDERSEKNAGDIVSGDDVIAVARKYEEQYREDEQALNIKEPFKRPRATETVKEMLAMVKDLLGKGQAYETDDGIYFDVTSTTLTPYGSLSGNMLENLNAGSRVEVKEEKRHPADFALWKKCVGDNARHLLRWSFETGERVQAAGEDASAGFPGWHIECSAMSRKFLGDTLDIHTGGEDNIFPHHECEIAQSESVTGKPFVRFWLHKRRIDLAGEKMSKSLGNVLTIPDIVAKGYSPLDLRYYFLSVHYRTNLKFTWKGMDDAHKARRAIMEWMNEVTEFSHKESEDEQKGVKESAEYVRRFTEAMDDDLNSSAALAVLFEAMSWYRNALPLGGDAFIELDRLIDMAQDTFGCFEPETEEIPGDILALAKERDSARAKKDFAASDRIRDELISLGYEVRDTPEGTKVKRK